MSGGASAPRWWWRLDPCHSIPARIAAVFAVLGAGMTLLLAFIAGAGLRRDIEARTPALLEHHAAQFALRIDRDLAERLEEIRLASERAVVRNALSPTPEGRLFLEALQGSLGLAWIGFADNSGMVVAGASGLLEGVSAGNEDWFRLGRAQPHVSDVHGRSWRTELSGPNQRFIDLAVPVREANGRQLGVLGAQLYWPYEQGNYTLSATVVADRITATLHNAAGQWLLSAGAPAGRDDGGAGGWKTREGLPYFEGMARNRGYRDFQNPGWRVSVRQPAEAAFAPLDALRGRLLRWGALLTLLGILPVWLVAARLTRRLRAVSAAAGRIGAGDLTALMPAARPPDEIARMAADLDDMVESLRERK